MPRAKENFPRATFGMRVLSSSALTCGFCFEFYESTSLI